MYTTLITPKDIRVTLGKNALVVLWYTYVYVLPDMLLLETISYGTLPYEASLFLYEPLSWKFGPDSKLFI